jgi:predicted RecB family nuclease
VPHIITDTLLTDFVNCVSKSYLRLHGQLGELSDYGALGSRLDARYILNASQWLMAESTIGGIGHFGGSRLEDKMTADAIILDAVGGADGLETRFHAIERTQDSQLAPFHYRPIRFCRYLRPRSTDHLLLAFDAFILGRLQGVCPDVGILLCGPKFSRSQVRLRPHLISLAIVLTRLRAQTTPDNEPPLELNRHCDICEFRQHCRPKAIEEDNLSLLKGMTSKEIARHNSKGIFSVKQLSYTFRARRPSKRQKRQFPHNFALQALALRQNKVHVLGEPILTPPHTHIS